MVLGGCATARMAVPGELAAAPDLAVSGRQGWNAGHELTFGAFRVDGVSHGATRVRRDRPAGDDGVVDAAAHVRTGRERSRERFRFRLREGDGPVWRTECHQAAEQHRSDLPVVGEVTHGFRASLACTVSPAADSAADGSTAAPWTLQLDEAQRLGGTLTGADTRFTLAGVNHMEGSKLGTTDATGVVFSRDGRAVAAVDLLNGGRVRIDPSLTRDQRAAIASAAAALLLRPDLEDELDRA
jgi:hypothetical protein